MPTICQLALFCFCARFKNHSFLRNAKFRAEDMICQNELKDSNKSDNKLKKFLSLNSASIKSTKARKLMIIKSVFFSKKRVAEINRIGNTEPTDKN